jgi:hypothetical protein
VALVVLFSKIVQPLEPVIRSIFSFFINVLKQLRRDSLVLNTEKNTTSEILLIIQSITGMEVKPEWSLGECGVASLGVVLFTNTLVNTFSTPKYKIKLSMPDIMFAHNIHEISSIVDNQIDASTGELCR